MTPQVVVCQWLVRPDAQNLAETRGRLRHLPLVPKKVAQHAVILVIFRIESKPLSIGRRPLGRLPQLREDNGQVKVKRALSRAQSDCLA